LRDCCAANEEGFRCAELLELCGKRELCVRHLRFPKSRQPGLNRQKPMQLAYGCTGLARESLANNLHVARQCVRPLPANMATVGLS
jgi:hypothetical protein